MMRLCGVPSEEAVTLSTSPEEVDSTIRRYLEPHVRNGHSIVHIRLFAYYLHQRMDAQFKQHRKFQQSHMRAIRALGAFLSWTLFRHLYNIDRSISVG